MQSLVSQIGLMMFCLFNSEPDCFRAAGCNQLRVRLVKCGWVQSVVSQIVIVPLGATSSELYWLSAFVCNH